MSLLSPPVYEAGGVRAPDVASLLAAGAALPRLDAEGVAALLWRGAAMGSRLPVAGVRRLAPPGPAVDLRPAAASRSTPAQFREALSAAIRAIPEPRRILDEPGLGHRALAAALRFDPAPAGDGAEARIVGGPLPKDMPAANEGDAFGVVARAKPFGDGVAHVSSAGARELFGAGPLFASFASLGTSARRPPRGPRGDPLDVDAQRAHEASVFGDVEAQRLHALAGLLPAATRAALSRVGPRPPDGVAPRTRGLALASDLLRLGRLRDRELTALELAARAAGLSVHCPFLDPAVVEAARGLPDRERFGEPGSGGLLASIAAEVAPPPHVELFGRLALTFEVFAPERLKVQGILVPEAVATAVDRFQRKAGGWTSEAMVFLHDLCTWIGRNRLSLAAS